MGLPRRVLALPGGQDLTQNGLRNLCLVDPGARHDRFDDRSPQIMGRGCRKDAVKAADGGAGGRHDYHIGHFDSSP